MNARITADVLREVQAERVRQDAKWGEQNHPDGTGGRVLAISARHAREDCEEAFAEGRGTWSHILMEEFWEARAECAPGRLREELIQVAAVAVAWVEAIDRRTTTHPTDQGQRQDAGAEGEL